MTIGRGASNLWVSHLGDRPWSSTIINVEKKSFGLMGRQAHGALSTLRLSGWAHPSPALVPTLVFEVRGSHPERTPTSQGQGAGQKLAGGMKRQPAKLSRADFTIPFDIRGLLDACRNDAETRMKQGLSASDRGLSTVINQSMTAAMEAAHA
jgi:hypothetical protein